MTSTIYLSDRLRTYDFFVKSCEKSETKECPKQFYLNVYVRKSKTSKVTFHDCNFVYSTKSGGKKGTWTTVDLSNILDQTASNTYTSPRTTQTQPDNGGCDGATPGARATTLKEYLAGNPDAVLSNNAFYTFTWNIGDTNDRGELEGCYDNLQFKIAGDYTRIYDFEPESAQ